MKTQTPPDTNPKTAFGQAKLCLSDTPVHSIRMLAAVHANGAAKYGSFNWRDDIVSSTVYYNAALRHLMAWFEGEDMDPESGLPHEAHVMTCMSIIMDARHHATLNDNRPKHTAGAGPC